MRHIQQNGIKIRIHHRPQAVCIFLQHIPVKIPADFTALLLAYALGFILINRFENSSGVNSFSSRAKE